MENRTLNIKYQKARYQENPEIQLVYKKCRYHENPENKIKQQQQQEKKIPRKSRIYKKYQK